MHVLMVAAENDILVGAKVGGVADVVRDVPTALVRLPEYRGIVTVVVPSYGFLHQPAKSRVAEVWFLFRGEEHIAELFEVEGKNPEQGVRQLVLHHPELASCDPITGQHRIYVNDSSGPFATDATRFALFNAAVIEGLRLGVFGPVDILHLHDWHTGVLQILREYDPRYANLKTLHTVFTIHNLALQGIRPLKGDPSSLETWFPNLVYDLRTVSDPEYKNCMNPMAAGIRLSNRVHAVSPAYAAEICEPSRPKRNDSNCVFFGGEGLEDDLQRAHDQGRLIGILNGSKYPSDAVLRPLDDASWKHLLTVLMAEIFGWIERESKPHHKHTIRRLREWQKMSRPAIVMTSVTRVVDQKVRLMRYPEGPSPIERILARTNGDAVFILAGNGDASYEQFFTELSLIHENFVFINGYSGAGADAIYEAGDLFLMPSAFEPCGISQMLAMRAGQPCVVHAIGGLKDTVVNDETGFTFSGKTPDDLGHNFVSKTLNAVRLKLAAPEIFDTIRQRAFAARFEWDTSVRQYLKQLYNVDVGDKSPKRR